MKIQEEFYEIILEEFKNVSKLCNDTNLLPEDKLYFFSASYGVINRIMNFNCEPILIFIHQILQSTHQAFAQRLSQRLMPGIISNSFPDVFWDKLFLYFSELISAFENKDENKIREILEKFSNLGYATSGNGFYLFLNEKLKI